jgi:ABC-type multidrug transport system fused ATPase/permease subunit
MQNVFLFDGTVAENIAYGNAEASIEEIKNAAEIAQLAPFIDKLSLGYNTKIGERGVKLSGGQAQRLSIARVLLTNPKILIMDEPTANVDAITDQNLISAVRTVMKNRTTIIIAHRLWTIKNADKIIVLKDGKIDSIGNHQDLIKQNGFYTEFFASQFHDDKEVCK